MLRGKTIALIALAAMVMPTASWALDDDASAGGVLSGIVTDTSGKPLRGAMVTAIDNEIHKTVTVFSQEDGKFQITGLPAKALDLRARLIGLEDTLIEGVKPSTGKGTDHAIKMAAASDINMQRRGTELISMLKWKSDEQALNFKMMCTYCHQVGTVGFRTPEEPVDWEVMVTRMDGFGGLHKDTQQELVGKLLETYSPEAIEKWPKWEAPEPPSGETLKYVITEFAMGKEDACMIHDLEVGDDGLIYVCDMINDAIATVDPKTGERVEYAFPGGKDPASTDVPILGPHSIEKAPNGDMWLTMALSGKMAKFDVKTKEFTLYESNENNRRGFYPHTLYFDQKGICWYTDAAMNSVFSINPADGAVKRYNLLKPTDVDTTRTGVRGEGGSIVPYGIYVAPDGMVWYSKLNGQRIGRIDPTATDPAQQIKEWKPPVYGPRRHAVGPDGLVWVPGFASGDIASFNPKTEEWKVYPLPFDGNILPYALNVDHTTGHVWVCGTGNDSMIKFDPKTEKMTHIPMPTQVTYTREVEFDKNGNVWVCNSNYPARHIENHRGSVIQISMR
jgi:virginiamycin B lyase